MRSIANSRRHSSRNDDRVRSCGALRSDCVSSSVPVSWSEAPAAVHADVLSFAHVGAAFTSFRSRRPALV
jgi:hypothetical protein